MFDWLTEPIVAWNKIKKFIEMFRPVVQFKFKHPHLHATASCSACPSLVDPVKTYLSSSLIISHVVNSIYSNPMHF